MNTQNAVLVVGSGVLLDQILQLIVTVVPMIGGLNPVYAVVGAAAARAYLAFRSKPEQEGG